ncbi:MAG: hypothetical protein Q4D62_04265 [Planctomycetia bacterium]|nr:hypothetical protein [Planctomycetia bacterium]
MENGMEKGRQEGLQEGVQKGKKEGIQEGQRKSLLTILQTRFGEVPGDVLEKIDSQEKNWGDLLTLSVTCTTLEEFCSHLKS